jgi:hypothetical protein
MRNSVSSPQGPRNMSDKPHRAWFQFHLSTAILLMFVAGVLLWANIRTNEHPPAPAEATYRIQNDFRDAWIQWATDSSTYSSYGWPCAVYSDSLTIDEIEAAFAGTPLKSRWHITSLAVNLGVGFTILLATVFPCEWLIRRRRESRAP